MGCKQFLQCFKKRHEVPNGEHMMLHEYTQSGQIGDRLKYGVLQESLTNRIE